MIKKTSIAGILTCACLLALVSPLAFAQEDGASQSFPSIKCEELKKMIDNNAADILVVSNEPQESYKEGHIPGPSASPG